MNASKPLKTCPGPENARCPEIALIGKASKRCPSCSTEQARIRHARRQREARALKRAGKPVVPRPPCPGTDLAPCRGFHRCTKRGKRCGDCQTLQRKLRDGAYKGRVRPVYAKPIQQLIAERPRVARLIELARAAGLQPTARAA